MIQQANALQPKIETWRKSLAEIAIPALSSLHYDQGKILERHKTRTLKDLELLNGVADSIRKGPESLQDDVLLMTFTDQVEEDFMALNASLGSAFVASAIKSHADMIMTANWSEHLGGTTEEVEKASKSVFDAVFAHLQQADVELGVYGKTQPRN